MRPLEKRQYKARLKAKEESMKIHVAECDRLRKENRRLRSIIKKFNEKTVSEANPIYCACGNPVIDKTITKRIQLCFCGGVVEQ